MMFCVVFVSVLGRDFGCMLTVERKQRVNNKRRDSGSITSEEGAIQTEKEGQLLLPHKRSPPLEDPEDDSLFEG